MGEHPLITAAELDEMTPDERAAEFNKRVVTDLTAMPVAFQDRVKATVEQLIETQQRRSA